MSYISHEAVLAVVDGAENAPDIESFRSSLPEEFQRLVIGPVAGAVNCADFYVFLPDGGGEGGETSDLGDEYRERFRALFTGFHVEVLNVKYGTSEIGPLATEHETS